MTDLTTAQTQAAELRAVANHLDAHPHLTRVNIHHTYLGVSLQQVGEWHAELSGLMAWALSLGATTAEVLRCGDRREDEAGARVHVHLHGVISGVAVRTWDAVPELDASDLTDGDVPVADLPGIAAETAAAVAREASLNAVLGSVRG